MLRNNYEKVIGKILFLLVRSDTFSFQLCLPELSCAPGCYGFVIWLTEGWSLFLRPLAGGQRGYSLFMWWMACVLWFLQREEFQNCWGMWLYWFGIQFFLPACLRCSWQCCLILRKMSQRSVIFFFFPLQWADFRILDQILKSSSILTSFTFHWKAFALL